MVGEVHQDLEKLNKLLKKKRNFNSWRIKTAGKLVYFLHYFVLELLVANNFSLVGVQICFHLRLSYFVAQVVWSCTGETNDFPFPFTWFTVHYCLGTVIYIISSYGRVHMKPEALGNFLEGVASSDLAGDPVVWRRIAYKTNQDFREMGYRYPLFYRGDQCLRSLIKDILKPVEAVS
ncbi:hypothetical protein BZL39_C03500 [Zygosaccharomyces parabailii]|nr:hypothetical protein BZL39_C03500 [Zygosaccharomyces parabailii]CDH09567.1 uncharacterized protein ZBAI_01351 [Zygosaccharomyces bailii ISA1307]